MGIAKIFLAAGHKVHATNFMHFDKLLAHLSFDEMEGPYPFALMLPQSETERLLTEELASRGVAIERDTELLSFEQSADSVIARLKKAGSGEEIATFAWLLGCDGAHSTTRHLLNMEFTGSTYPESFATADVHVAWKNPEDELFGFVNDEGILFFFPMGDKRYRIIADGPLHKTGDQLSLEEIQQTVNKRGPGDVILSDPVWLTWFTINRRSAGKYREGRVFLIGDAAHIHSPALGQGMNTGMQDAINLAWKLELVQKKLAASALLDTYQEERHPVGQALLKLTDTVTKLVTTRSPIVQGVRNRLLPLLASHEVVQHRAWKTLSMLGINYRHSSLVGQHRPGLAQSVSEAPAWLDFAHGPSPGDRAPDGPVEIFADASGITGSHSGEGNTTSLFEVLSGERHSLLFFSGLERELDSQTSIEETIAHLRKKFSEDVLRIYVLKPENLGVSEVSIKSENGDGVCNSLTLKDPENYLHHRYGAKHSCAYTIRPDGYVGYRSMPVCSDAILNNLRKTFSASAT
jgi:2-polyprenyl-6-methoxyphenol hydroxylase-like FAD-dependent oxidoreductase